LPVAGNESGLGLDTTDFYVTGLIGKWGLGPRDLAPNVNFFSRVTVGDDGGMRFEPGNSPPGGTVELRAEMNVLVLISNCPQINNPCNGFDPTPIRVVVAS
jgi:uncharacterized protein YcgI (DUF1989 family)